MSAADQPAPLTDLTAFLAEFGEESDRAGAIVGGTYLDDLLRQLLVSAMVPQKTAVADLVGGEDKMERPLSSFASRIRATYCMGLISKSEYGDLQQIKAVRNRFAHAQHGCTFADPKVVKACNAMTLPRHVTSMNVPPEGAERNWFNLSVALCAAAIGARIKNASANRASTPVDYDFSQLPKRNRAGA